MNHAAPSGQDVTWHKLARTRDVEEWDGPVRVIRLGRVAGVSRLELCPSLVTVLPQLCRGADIVHVHAPNVTMYLGLLPQRFSARLVVTHHSDVIKQRYLGRGFALVERAVLARAAQVFTDSAQYVDGSRVLARQGSKLRVLPLGIELEPFLKPSPAAQQFAAELRREHGEVLWVCVGRLIYYKGLDVALRALQQVPGKLLIVGRGPLAEPLRRLSAELGIAERVVWKDFLEPDQLTGAYLAARALWFPSVARSEGFGLVQVEAMASGCPVLNTRIHGSGVPWVSLDGVSGLTVPPGDAGALALAARQLLDNPELARLLGQGGRQRAQAEFSAERMAERSLDFYREALGLARSEVSECGVSEPEAAVRPIA